MATSKKIKGNFNLTIGIIDDRDDQRETLKTNLELSIPKNWEVIDTQPLQSVRDYPCWITENDVALILLDERLNEQGRKGRYASYKGHELVDFIRKSFPTFPIFVITAYPKDPDLIERFKDVEEIIDRTEFYKKKDGYVPRFLRAAQKFVEAHHAELEKLSELAEKIAKGNASKNELSDMKAIQGKFGLIFVPEIVEERESWISKFNEKISGLEKLETEIEKYLKTKKSK